MHNLIFHYLDHIQYHRNFIFNDKQLRRIKVQKNIRLLNGMVCNFGVG